MALFGKVVELSAVPLNPVAVKLRESYIARSGNQEGKFGQSDWHRISYVHSRLRRAHNCLEVGPGRGFLTRMMIRNKKYEKVTAIDIIPRPALTKHAEFQIMDVSSLEFPDKSFDAVIVLEVLEHLQDDAFKLSLNEIRRVCRKQLLISVPYYEPTPILKFHHQRFTEKRVQELFPNATFNLLLKEPVTRFPWLLIEETFDKDAAPQ